MDKALIGSTRGLWGGLGNMSPHPVFWNGPPWDRELVFPRAEQLFQAMRFPPEHSILGDMLRMKNPMAAKMRAKSMQNERVITACSPMDVENMRLVLRAKHRQHGEIRELLQQSRGLEIVEDCTKRPQGSFWGAVLQEDGSWVGGNWLGKLWMEIRG